MKLFHAVLAALVMSLAAVTAHCDEPLFEQTDVFVAGADGICEYRIPALVTSIKGTLIAVCDGRVSKPGDAPNNIDLMLKRSTDGGKTWSPVKRIVDYPGGAAAADPSLLVDQTNGRIWTFYAHAPEGIGSRQSKPGLSGPTFRYEAVTSDDDGITWSKPRDLNSMVKRPEWNAFWPGPGRGTQTRDGRLLVPSSRWQPTVNPSNASFLVLSDDHGKTWKTLGPSGTNTNETQCVELDDGSIMMNMRSRRGKHCRAVSVSADGGKTWSELVDDAALIEPVCQASLIRFTSTKDGAQKYRLLFSNPASRSARVNMTVRLSYDEGKTWPVAKQIHAGPTAYSCLTVLADGTIGLLYERGDRTPYEKITFAKFNIDWLTDGKDSLQGSK